MPPVHFENGGDCADRKCIICSSGDAFREYVEAECATLRDALLTEARLLGVLREAYAALGIEPRFRNPWTRREAIMRATARVNLAHAIGVLEGGK